MSAATPPPRTQPAPVRPGPAMTIALGILAAVAGLILVFTHQGNAPGPTPVPDHRPDHWRPAVTKTAVTVVRATRAVFLAVLYLLGLVVTVAAVLFLLVRPMVLPYRAR